MTLVPRRFAPHGTRFAVDPVPPVQTKWATTMNASSACNGIETNGESDRAAGAAWGGVHAAHVVSVMRTGQRVPDP
ncbi:hypothetical protein CVS37_21515 [Burkholderia lata]|nr:hypothetical protein CVS37_21515 [Burkholderia lata]